MPDTWFERLFKFNPLNFAEGDIGLLVGPALAFFGLLLAVFVVGFAAIYLVTNIFASNRARAVSLALRLSALLLLALPLFEPVLIMPDVVPDENFVAVLVDASESMSIPDGTDGATRQDDALRLLLGEADGEAGGIVSELEAFFNVRYYAFGDRVVRTDSIQYAGTGGSETNLSAGLDRVIADFKGVPLAGIVVLTDGGDNSMEVPLNKAEELRALDIPLHVVGLGADAFEEEREILDATVGLSVEATTGAEVDVKVRSWVEEEEAVEFSLYRNEERVFSEQRRLKGGGKIDQFTFFYEPEEDEGHPYILKIEEAPNELNTANNAIDLLIDTRTDTIRVLYFEGHPRSEFKYTKRAMEDDQVIEFTSLMRTGPGRHYRQGIKASTELAGGFPTDRAALYQYKAVMLGDIEASAFSLEQIEMLEEFVRVRGGGFLMLGGTRAFAEGDYWNTAVADMLPLEIDPDRRQVVPATFVDPGNEDVQGFTFVPTAVGYESPILKLSSDPAENIVLWNNMPALQSLNFLGNVKPGAVVLAEKLDDDFGGSEPLLAVQRYGRGRSAALATAGTWRWQMQLPADDMRHERFWRQLVRWLVASAPDAVNLELGTDRFIPNEEIPLRVAVFDSAYAPLDNAAVTGFVTDPFGGTREVVFQPDLTEAGTYMATFVPQNLGVYEVEVEALQDDRRLGTDIRSFLVQASRKEYHDATLKRDFLSHLVQVNQGVYYEPGGVGQLPDNLRGRRTSTSIYHAEYLWDMPVLWGLVLVLLSAEWIYRRRKGLP